MKKLFILMSVLSFIFADILHITSKNFYYDSKKLESVFIGDVNATKGKDNIVAQKMIVYFNKTKKPIKFEAQGHVKFILNDENITYKGHCDKLIYNFLTTDVFLIGNAFVKKLQTNESIKGDKIKLNRKNKTIEVKGSKKPVNIIIKVNE